MDDKIEYSGGRRDRERNEGAKLSLAQWIQITTAIITMLAGAGVWVTHSSGSVPEVTESRKQLDDLTKQVIQLELDNERMKYQIEDLQEMMKSLRGLPR